MSIFRPGAASQAAQIDLFHLRPEPLPRRRHGHPRRWSRFGKRLVLRLPRTCSVPTTYRSKGCPRGPVDSLFLTATTLKDRSKRSDGLHTMEAFHFRAVEGRSASGKPANTESAPPITRPPRRTSRIICTPVSRGSCPGLRDHVVFEALGTPLTNRHYVASTEGNLYGTEKSRLQLGPFAMQPTTEIDGLFLCGASTGSPRCGGGDDFRCRGSVSGPRFAVGAKS